MHMAAEWHLTCVCVYTKIALSIVEIVAEFTVPVCREADRVAFGSLIGRQWVAFIVEIAHASKMWKFAIQFNFSRMRVHMRSRVLFLFSFCLQNVTLMCVADTDTSLIFEWFRFSFISAYSFSFAVKFV